MGYDGREESSSRASGDDKRLLKKKQRALEKQEKEERRLRREQGRLLKPKRNSNNNIDHESTLFEESDKATLLTSKLESKEMKASEKFKYLIGDSSRETEKAPKNLWTHESQENVTTGICISDSVRKPRSRAGKHIVAVVKEDEEFVSASSTISQKRRSQPRKHRSKGHRLHRSRKEVDTDEQISAGCSVTSKPKSKAQCQKSEHRKFEHPGSELDRSEFDPSECTLSSERHRSHRHRSDRHRSDRHRSHRHRSDRHRSHRHRSDHHRSDRHRSDRYRSDHHRSDRHRSDRLPSKGHRSKPHHRSKHSKTSNRELAEVPPRLHRKSKGYETSSQSSYNSIQKVFSVTPSTEYEAKHKSPHKKPKRHRHRHKHHSSSSSSKSRSPFTCISHRKDSSRQGHKTRHKSRNQPSEKGHSSREQQSSRKLKQHNVNNITSSRRITSHSSSQLSECWPSRFPNDRKNIGVPPSTRQKLSVSRSSDRRRLKRSLSSRSSSNGRTNSDENSVLLMQQIDRQKRSSSSTTSSSQSADNAPVKDVAALMAERQQKQIGVKPVSRSPTLFPSIRFSVIKRLSGDGEKSVYVCGEIPELGGHIDPSKVKRNGCPLLPTEFKDHHESDFIEIKSVGPGTRIIYKYYVLDEKTGQLLDEEHFARNENYRYLTAPQISGKNKTDRQFCQMDKHFGSITNKSEMKLYKHVEPDSDSDSIGI